MTRVRRSYLYWGVFLAALGGTLVYADLVGVDEELIAQALGLWPFVFVAIGVALVLRRTSFDLAGGMLAAALPGLLIGGAVAAGPTVAIDCGRGTPNEYVTSDGGFSGPAEVDVTLDCGTLSVTTEPGAAWRLEAGNTKGRTPDVDASDDRLSIDGSGFRGWPRSPGRDDWRLALPTTPIDELDVTVNAGEGRVSLPDARVDRLDLTTNAGRSIVDLSGTVLGGLDATVNAGELSLDLSADDDLTGSLSVNAGSLQLCAPPDLGLQIRETSALGSTSLDGLVRDGSVWQSPNYESAVHRADLDVSVNLGNLDLNPIGGCK